MALVVVGGVLLSLVLYDPQEVVARSAHDQPLNYYAVQSSGTSSEAEAFAADTFYENAPG